MTILTRILQYAQKLGQAITPVGTVLPFAGSIEPAKFLFCDGRAVSRTTYAKLFALLGTKFGSGDGSSTFNLPDFRNKTFWGADGNVGSVLSSGLPNIKGEMSTIHRSNMGAIEGCFCTSSYSKSISTCWHGTATQKTPTIFNASLCNSIYGASTIVQPPALAVNFIIKY